MVKHTTHTQKDNRCKNIIKNTSKMYKYTQIYIIEFYHNKKYFIYNVQGDLKIFVNDRHVSWEEENKQKSYRNIGSQI